MSKTNSSDERDLVTVIMPCYNSERFLDEALLSIENQTYKNLEILVLDDCSTDRTINIIERHSQKDSRITVIRHAVNQGIVKSLNEMIEMAHGAYICRMDGDDISLPRRIEIQLRYLKSHPEIDICGTYAIDINEEGKELYRNRVPAEYEDHRIFLSYFCTLYHPSIMANADFYKDNPYDLDYLHCEDYELWCRAVFSAGVKLCNIPMILIKYRISSGSISSVYLKEQISKSKGIYEKYHMVPLRYLSIHNDLFVTKAGDADPKALKRYIKSVRKRISGRDINAQIVVYEKIIYYLKKNRKYKELISICLCPIGFITVADNVRRKFNKHMAGFR